jgi:ankyrin repeat protein
VSDSRLNIANFVCQFRNLTELTLEIMKYSSWDPHLDAFVENCPELRLLGLGPCEVSIDALQKLEKLPKLTNLGIGWVLSVSRIGKDTDQSLVLSILESLVGAMPSRIGINFFMSRSYIGYESFMKHLSNFADENLAEAVAILGADLTLPSMDRSGTVFSELLAGLRYGATSKLFLHLLDSPAKCDPGIVTKEGRSLFLETASVCQAIPLEKVQNIFTLQLEKARRLHPENESLFLRDSRGVSVIMQAMLHEKHDCIQAQYIISQAERLGLQATTDYYGNTVAHLASLSYGDVTVTLRRTKEIYVVDLNAKNVYLQKPLHCIRLLTFQFNLLKILDLGVAIDAQDLRTPFGEGTSSRSLLCVACRYAPIEIITRWLEIAEPASAQPDMHGYGPLHAAALTIDSTAASKAIEVLLEHKERLQLDVNATLCSQPDDSSFQKLPESARAAGTTPLHLSVASLHNRATELLLHAGAVISSTVRGVTPLHLAAERAAVPMISTILRHCKQQAVPALLQRDDDGRTPLLIIVYKLGMIGFENKVVLECVREFIQAAGMRAPEMVNLADARGNTALFYCRRRCDNEICDVLKRAGATSNDVKK